jgi:arabinofuranosyltransferase
MIPAKHQDKPVVKSTPVDRVVLAALTIAFVVWAAVFIWQTSYVSIDGRRYFGLFDDAMISMRYAWNLVHGSGLLWNPGERVEGYSNLLMTLIMSLASLFFNKSAAVLAVQIAGIPTVLGAAWLARDLAIRAARGLKAPSLAGTLTFACVLLYFPMSYWTLLGMETGLLTVLVLTAAHFGLRWLEAGRRLDLSRMAIAAGLAFLTRNDSIILVTILFGFLVSLSWLRNRDLAMLRQVAGAAMIVGLFIAAQTVFRYAYYGELLPNTYVLKLTNYPLNIRLIDGTHFVLRFLGQTWPLFVLAASSLWHGWRPIRLLMAALVLAVLGYQVYAGGDPWDTWRMLAPGMPLLFALAVIGAAELAPRLALRLGASRQTGTAAAVLLLIALIVADRPFLSDMAVRGPTSAAIANRTNTNAAIAITALTRPEASVGVIWAGTLPYYADRYAIDFLGKSDPYVARLNADVSGSSGWGNQISIPGHNKYDLEYSIVQRQPTYSQGFSWGYATVRPYFVQNYVRVEYHGAAGTKTIFLLKDSPLVCWEECRDQYRIIPWPK